MILGHEGEINLPLLEQMFLQGRYDDLPAPIKMKGENITPYTTQVFIIKKESTHDIVKHVRFADNTKVLDSVIVNMCSGQPLEVDYQKHFREGSRALQHMLEGLGGAFGCESQLAFCTQYDLNTTGVQVRYCKLVPAGSRGTKPTKETEDIGKGFAFIKEYGPMENSEGQMTVWAPSRIFANFGRSGVPGKHHSRLAPHSQEHYTLGSRPGRCASSASSVG